MRALLAWDTSGVALRHFTQGVENLVRADALGKSLPQDVPEDYATPLPSALVCRYHRLVVCEWDGNGAGRRIRGLVANDVPVARVAATETSAWYARSSVASPVCPDMALIDGMRVSTRGRRRPVGEPHHLAPGAAHLGGGPVQDLELPVGDADVQAPRHGVTAQVGHPQGRGASPAERRDVRTVRPRRHLPGHRR